MLAVTDTVLVGLLAVFKAGALRVLGLTALALGLVTVSRALLLAAFALLDLAGRAGVLAAAGAALAMLALLVAALASVLVGVLVDALVGEPADSVEALTAVMPPLAALGAELEALVCALAVGFAALNPVAGLSNLSPQIKNTASGSASIKASVANMRLRRWLEIIFTFCLAPAKTEAAVSDWRGVAGAIGIGAAACIGAAVGAGIGVGIGAWVGACAGAAGVIAGVFAVVIAAVIGCKCTEGGAVNEMLSVSSGMGT